MHYQAIIVGGGPGGLTCAKILAEHGLKCIVIEQKSKVGPKVCAGGLTWSGMVQQLPDHIFERSFTSQYIKTRFQDFHISSDTPIITTVNRENLGRYMSNLARDGGAEILTGSKVISISSNKVQIKNKTTGTIKTLGYDYLIGADGSSSLVRRHLGLQTTNMGIGIHYQVTAQVDKMEWYLDGRYFKNGYSWIFPHKQSISIGAFVDKNVMPARLLKKNLLQWANKKGYDLQSAQPRAEFINFDYNGYQFDHVFLLGDAAGLASPLTGEGIYPAIISAEVVAATILNLDHDMTIFNRLIKKQKFFLKMIKIAGGNKLLNSFMIELGVLSLRLGLVRVHDLEMA